MSLRNTLSCAVAQQFPQNEDRPALRRTLMRFADACGATGLSRSAIYRLIRDEKFPAPVRLTANVVVWPSDEIQAWIDARIAERDAARAEKVVDHV